MTRIRIFGKRSILLCAALLLMAAALVACDREVVLYERVEFPGFSLELPPGEDISDPEGYADYADGEFLRHAHMPSPAPVLGVVWSPDGPLDGEVDQHLVDLTASLIVEQFQGEGVDSPELAERRRTLADGEPVYAAAAPFRHGMVELSMVFCGARSVWMFAVGTQVRADAQIERMLKTFECQPDPIGEQALAALQPDNRSPVAFDAVGGWYLIPDPDIFIIYGGGMEAAFMRVSTSELAAAHAMGFDRGLDIVMAGMGDSWTRLGSMEVQAVEGARVLAFGQLESDGEIEDVVTTIWSCPDGTGASGIVFADAGLELPRERMAEILLAARCLRPGEPPPQFMPRLALQLQGEDSIFNPSLAEILAAIDRMATANESHIVFMQQLDTDDFVQSTGADGSFTVQWLVHGYDADRYWVAGKDSDDQGEVDIASGEHMVQVRSNEVLDIADVKYLLEEFAMGRSRPAQYHWREITEP